MNLLEVKDLSVYFENEAEKVFAVQHLNFSLKKGESLGIVGESGSGKTVTAMSILKLLAPNAKIQSGAIIYYENNQGRELLSLSEEQIRPIRGRKIAMIFQEPMSALNPVLTCGYQVAEALLAHNLSTKKDCKEKVCYWFEKVGLTEPQRIYASYPHQLSGGQLQRVLIALALVCNPEIIIADEPTTALDVQIQQQILHLLIQLKNEFSLSLIFISHDLGVIKKICDRVIVMHEGKLVEEAGVQDIFNNPQQAYTKGLIASKPPLHVKLRTLPTVKDFFEGKTNRDFYDDIHIIHDYEIDRQLETLKTKEICIRDLNVKYPVKRNWFGRVTQWKDAAKNISFDIHQGETIGLVGESGSGKSSIGRAILGLTPLYSGNVQYKNIELNKLNHSQWRKLRKDLQIIFQDPYSSLNPRKNIEDTLLEPMEIHNLFPNKKERLSKAVDLLENVGLKADALKRYPHQFSGGQRQRICIARALSLEPKFIVCDESVSALDVSVQAQVLNLLKELKDKYKLSYLFISHDLSVVNFIADRIAVLKDGELIEFGKSYEIIRNPKEKYTQNLIEAIPN